MPALKFPYQPKILFKFREINYISSFVKDTDKWFENNLMVCTYEIISVTIKQIYGHKAVLNIYRDNLSIC